MHNTQCVYFKVFHYVVMLCSEEQKKRKKVHHGGCPSRHPQSRCLSNPILHNCRTPKTTIKKIIFIYQFDPSSHEADQ